MRQREIAQNVQMDRSFFMGIVPLCIRAEFTEGNRA